MLQKLQRAKLSGLLLSDHVVRPERDRETDSDRKRETDGDRERDLELEYINTQGCVALGRFGPT